MTIHAARTVLPTEDRMDAALCDQVRAGNTGAFEQVFRRHRHYARQVAVRMVGADEADDVVAETFAALLAALVRGNGPQGPIRPYLATALRHQVARMLAPTDAVIPTLEVEEDRLVGVAGTLSPEESTLARADRDAASRALRRLPPRRRQIIELVDVDGLSYAEAAERMGVQRPSLGRLLHEARRALFDAWIAEHIPAASDDTHPSELELARHLTGTAGRQMERRVTRHLNGCSGCSLRVAAIDGEHRWRGRRASALGLLGLLPLWFRLRGQRHPRRLRSLSSPVKAGMIVSGVTVLGVLGGSAVLAPSGSAADAPQAVPSVVTVADPEVAAEPVEGIDVQWTPGSTLVGAAADTRLTLTFRIVAESASERAATLTIVGGAGVVVDARYRHCEQDGDVTTCAGIGPFEAGEVLDGQVTVTVTDPSAATLPTLAVTR